MTQADENVTLWQTPRLTASGRESALTHAHREELAALRIQAQQEGRAAGIQQATDELRARMEAGLEELATIVNALRRPYEELGDDVVEELARLAGHIARQLLRRELKTSPEAIVGVVREALASLPEGREGATVYLNSEDLQLVEELTATAGQEQGWELLSDPALPRGDCVVVRGASVVDASLEERARVAMLQVLGGERSGDSSQ